MKLALHRRIALWTVLLTAFAFFLFGLRTQTVVFAAFAVVTLAYLLLRLRSEITRPLADLSDSVRQAASGAPMRLPISQAPGQIQEMGANLAEWSARMEARIDDLSAARLRLESILSAMGEGVLVFDRRHRIVLANDALGKLMRLSPLPMGKTCLEVFRNELLDRAVEQVLGGEHSDAVEFQTPAEVTVRALLSPMRDQDSTEIEAVVSVLHDVTDIRQIDRVRRDFVANVSHEFKTPLTSIRGYAETMLSGEVADPHREFVSVI